MGMGNGIFSDSKPAPVDIPLIVINPPPSKEAYEEAVRQYPGIAHWLRTKYPDGPILSSDT